MFTLPLWDDNPTHRTPWVTWLLMAISIAVFLWQQSLPDTGERAFVFAFGVIPAVLLGGAELSPELAIVPPWASVFTSMFVHGGWMHLIGNMLYLW
ncbi:MAG: rhomboid family intramembrane serine protease, partial [Alphaproteobacteria bacterium]|nr:rhomboid family intramembrane serine protease [Alphaproteobacteria bacterium]